MRVLVTGATGFLGRALCAQLPTARILTRDVPSAKEILPSVEAHAWDPLQGPPDPGCFDGVDAVIHLAGESMASGRWTEDRKRRLTESRVLGTRHLVRGLAAAAQRPRVFVCASGAGYYGDTGDQEVDELSPAGSDFVAGLCVAWEKEAMTAEELGVRVACMRMGVVLGPEGGALDRMVGLFRLGLGGRLGSGRQWMPWVSLADTVGLFLHAIGNDSVRGPVNVVSPGTATNGEFTQALGRALHRPTILPVPGMALRVALGEMAGMLLASQRILPRKALDTGYAFQHVELEDCLRAAVA